MANIIARADKANVPSIVTTTGEVLPANLSRRGWYIQNVGQVPVFICVGTPASTTVFHHVIKGGTADNDGLGGAVGEMEGVVGSQAIYATVAAGTMKIVVKEY